ncbi:Hypothetical predicted protein [Podarcis lilfordi]|uniref:Uncharacterized protein n=1 Tax=Podarcis lilfordi TaxID=74358 RepID=A0AA35KZD1_9SAUR|nr:Hypothetical predicted protein [Podarcis lilfordi]
MQPKVVQPRCKLTTWARIQAVDLSVKVRTAPDPGRDKPSGALSTLTLALSAARQNRKRPSPLSEAWTGKLRLEDERGGTNNTPKRLPFRKGIAADDALAPLLQKVRRGQSGWFSNCRVSLIPGLPALSASRHHLRFAKGGSRVCRMQPAERRLTLRLPALQFAEMQSRP